MSAIPQPRWRNPSARVTRTRSLSPSERASMNTDQHGDAREIRSGAECRHSNTGTKANRLWQRVKQRSPLVDFHTLPDYLRDNEYILRYYRADWPLKEAMLSIFRIHNETLNIWTHFVGFLLFLCLTICTIYKLPKVEHRAVGKFSSLATMGDLPRLQAEIMACFPSLSSIPNLFSPKHVAQLPAVASLPPASQQCFVQSLRRDLEMLMAPYLPKPATRWPFFIFLGGAMFCLLSSSTCHLLSCHSSYLSYFLWRLDYAGIAAMIATSFFPPIYYTFLCHPLWRNIYLTGISVVGVATVLVSLIPVFQTPKYRGVRALLFFGMGISGVIPGIHKLISHSHEPVTFQTLTYEILMGVFYGIGTLFYATRFPERWKPGCFDIAGHSHQIFHAFVVAGAYTHYKTALLYLQWRDAHGCE